MPDGLDVPLEDADIREEVELVSSLIIAAGETDEVLTPDEIDQLLGVRMVLPEVTDQDPTEDS